VRHLTGGANIYYFPLFSVVFRRTSWSYIVFLLHKPHPMLHFYDLSPWSIDIQRVRLKPACALFDAHIKFLVWGEDALAYIHFIPMGLFNLYQVASDQDLQRTFIEIMQSLPYKICSPIPRIHLELFIFDQGHFRTPSTSS